jgi:hypothetical protein
VARRGKAELSASGYQGEIVTARAIEKGSISGQSSIALVDEISD